MILEWKGQNLLAPLVVLLVLAGGSASSPDAEASGPTGRSTCGVRLLSEPLIVTGVARRSIDVPPIGEVIGDVIDQIVSISGPASDAVQCQPISLRRGSEPMARGTTSPRCENSKVSGARLKRRLASKAVRCLINKQRSKRGLNGLDPRKTLKMAAKRHSRRMVSRDCFSHQCGGEPDIVGRVISTGYLPCGCSWTVGEDIAWGERGKSTPAAIVAAWMASPPHRDLILLNGLKHVEVGVAPGKPGNGHARAATYTADFGYKR